MVRSLGAAQLGVSGPGSLKRLQWNCWLGMCSHLKACLVDLLPSSLIWLSGALGPVPHGPPTKLPCDKAAGFPQGEQRERERECLRRKPQSSYNWISEVTSHAIFYSLETNQEDHLTQKDRGFHISLGSKCQEVGITGGCLRGGHLPQSLCISCVHVFVFILVG